MDSRTLTVGVKLLLAYDHHPGPGKRNATIPPDRIVRVNSVDAEGFGYDVLEVELGCGFMPLWLALQLGARIREGRRIWHHDFSVNMASRSRIMEGNTP